MAEGDRSMSLPALERSLRELGARIAYPDAPGLAAVVSRRLASEAETHRRVTREPRMRQRRTSRKLVFVAAVIGLSLVATAAVAARLGIGGISFRFAPVTAPAPPRAADDLGLGRPVPIDVARLAVGFPVRVPTLAELGPPDAVFLDPSVPGGAVGLVYLPRSGLPEIAETGLGMVITQFGGEVEGVKEYGGDKVPEPVEVAGQPGYWLEGPHLFFYLDEAGEPKEATERVVGNALLWVTDDGVILRLESALSRDDAMRVGASIRPGGPAVVPAS
jgi:hypothetical protein